MPFDIGTTLFNLFKIEIAEINLAFHQQAANQLVRHLFCGAAEKGLGEVLGERGGFGSGLAWVMGLRVSWYMNHQRNQKR